MHEQNAIAKLMKLRELRVRKDDAPRVDVALAKMADELARVEKKLGGAGGAWASVCPAGLAARTTPVSLARGTLNVEVADAAVRYEVDRWLRAGGEQAVIAASRTPIRKVRLVLGRGA